MYICIHAGFYYTYMCTNIYTYFHANVKASTTSSHFCTPFPSLFLPLSAPAASVADFVCAGIAVAVVVVVSFLGLAFYAHL